MKYLQKIGNCAKKGWLEKAYTALVTLTNISKQYLRCCLKSIWIKGWLLCDTLQLFKQ